MALTIHRHPSVEAFLATAGGFLAAREAEHNLIFGITSWLQGNPELVQHAPSYLTVSDAGGEIIAASVRTPPHNQVLSMVDDPRAVDLLADELREEELPGVLGAREPAARFAARWCAAGGRQFHVQVAERIFRLRGVIPPARPAPGSWRLAQARDRDLIARWLVAFTAEAIPEDPPIPDPQVVADRWVAGVGRLVYLWEHGGEVVSLVAAGGRTPNGIRIGPVYTPPERRGRGYASALTAAASQDQLDRGRRFCFLFTDLSNPTSNKIYQDIGYEPVCDMDQYRFTDA